MSRGRGMRMRRIEGISSQEYCSGLPFPSPGDLLNPGFKLPSPALRADFLPSKPSGKRQIEGGMQLIFEYWFFPQPCNMLANSNKYICRFIQISSVAQSCPTLCDPMNCSTPGLPVHHQLPEFTQTHVHWVGDAIQPSHPLLSPSPAPNPSQHQGLFQWVNSSHEVAKVLEFQPQHQSFQWTPRTGLL